MKPLSSEMRLYVDTMIVNTILSDDPFLKTAQSGGMAANLIDTVKNYVSSKIDSSNKTESFTNIVGPGLISVMMGGWLGPLIGFGLRAFHINLYEIMTSIFHRLTGSLHGKNQLDSEHIDQVTAEIVNEHVGNATPQELDQSVQELDQEHKLTVTQELRNAQLVSLAFLEYKSAQRFKRPYRNSFTAFNQRKTQMRSWITVVLSLLFKVAFASAGLMILGDAANLLVGGPNSFDGTIKNDKPVAQTSTVISTQKKFPETHPGANNTRPANWTESVSNTKEGIENMIINFAKNVYQGLDGQEANIRSTSGFEAIVDNILWFNHSSKGGPIVFIPSIFSSKKMLVDHFIDEVAEKAK